MKSSRLDFDLAECPYLEQKIEVEAQPLAEVWAQFAPNRCGIQRLSSSVCKSLANDKHLICCG
jgi:hypothetical protein